MNSTSIPRAPSQPKLLDQVRDLALARGHPETTVPSFVDWYRRFILFHDKRHPQEMGLAEICRFLEHVVNTERDPLPALQASRAALEFLYGEVLLRTVRELPWPQPPRLLDQVR